MVMSPAASVRPGLALGLPAWRPQSLSPTSRTVVVPGSPSILALPSLMQLFKPQHTFPPITLPPCPTAKRAQPVLAASRRAQFPPSAAVAIAVAAERKLPKSYPTCYRLTSRRVDVDPTSFSIIPSLLLVVLHGPPWHFST